MANIWKSDNLNHPNMIFVEGISQTEIYIYNKDYMNKGRVPYTKITEKEALQLISSYIYKIFNNQPPSRIGSIDFVRWVFNELALILTINRARLEENLPPGVACQSGYVCVNENSKYLDFIPYTHETFVTTTLKGDPPLFSFTEYSQNMIKISKTKDKKIIMVDHHDEWFQSEKNFENSEKLDPINAIKEYISKPHFTDFIKVITENDNIKMMSLRSILQRVILSPREGRNYQQCFWLYGDPGTTKSTWAEIAKMFAQGSVMELSKSNNQFTSFSLKDKKLLLISDVERIPKDMIESLRIILGRDQLYYEAKHENVYDFIEPYCQVIIISNKSPDQFPLIWERSELREKITSLKFSYPISQKFMISNLKNHLEQLAIPLLLWSLFTPRFFLKQQTRGKLLKSYMEKFGTNNKTNLHYFIEEMLCTSTEPSANIYITKDELRNKFEEWSSKNGTLSEISDKNKFLLYLPRNIMNILALEYKIMVEEKRPLINKTRILVISGVTLKQGDKDQLSLKRIELPQEECFDFGALDPLYEIKEIEGPSLYLEDFHNIQKQILQQRGHLE